MAVALARAMIESRRNRVPPLAALALVGTLLGAACDRGAEDQPPGARAPAATAGEVADTAEVFISPEVSSDDRPVALYPDLTRYDWYARAEPLVHDGRAYTPGGALVAAPASAMEPVGEFGGVAYYREAGAGVETLYVPVYERYWLAFRVRDSVPGN